MITTDFTQPVRGPRLDTIHFRGRCLDGDTLIDTPQGGRKLADLQIGDEVYTEVNGTRVIAHVTLKARTGTI